MIQQRRLWLDKRVEQAQSRGRFGKTSSEMSKPKKKQNQKKASPALQGDTTPSGVTAPMKSAAVPERVELPAQKSNWFEHFKIALQFIGVITAIVALLVSAKSCGTAKESLALSKQQAEDNRRYHQEYVKPDVRAVIRHSSSPTQKDNAIAAELVVWNNGPIKAVSLSGAYRVYILNPTNFYVVASMGISEPLVD